MIRAMAFLAFVVLACGWAADIAARKELTATRAELSAQRDKVRVLSMLVGRFGRELRQSDRSRPCLEGWEAGCARERRAGDDV